MSEKSINTLKFILISLGIILPGILMIFISCYFIFETIVFSLRLFLIILIYIILNSSLLYLSYRKIKKVEKKLYSISIHDDLTGLKNMRYFKNRIQETISSATRYEEKFGLILFDLDNFKYYNDRFGHRAGDELLKKMANFFDKQVRQEEVLARYGGDEFILLLPDISLKEAEKTAQRLCKELEEKSFNLQEREEVYLQISSGIAIYPDDGKTLKKLIDKADQNLYKSKKMGINVCSSRNNKNNNFGKFSVPPRSLVISNKDEYLNKVAKKTTQLYLLAKSENIEIIKQKITSDKRFQIQLEKEENFEFFYILAGEILYSEENKILSTGDYIAVQGLTEETYFKTLTEVTVLYITHIPVFESEQNKIKNLISLNREIAEKDVETNKHCKRLQKLSQLTGEKLNLNEKQLFCLGYASFLHDIGKAKLPTSLINKPGKLSSQEWEQMKKHPRWGYELILKNLSSTTFKRVARIVYQHHERYDGKGYPQGLSGDEILIEAKILTTVDAFDAMTYDRPYRSALSKKEARKELISEKGKQFAPRVVEAFLEIEKEVNLSK